MKAMLRRVLVSVAGSLTLLCASTAFAEGEACYNDDDCPNPACGGDVCNWGKLAATGDGRKIFYCQAAGQEAKGQDGWCETDANCKCKATGATCNTGIHHCTDTGTPAAGGSGAGGSGTAGTTSSAGTGGSGTAGTASTAGTTASAGSGSAPAPAADDGGCSVGVPGNTTSGALVALGVAGLGLALARRRR